MWPPLNIGEAISNACLCDIFKCANMGGMRYSSTYHALIFISNHVMNNPYDDKWVNGILYYTGEGKSGDQPNPPVKQNKRLCNRNYEACYLFEVFSKGEFTYKGRVDLASTPLYGPQHSNGRQPDSTGRIRNVWIFPLKLVDEFGEFKSDTNNKFLGAIGVCMTDLRQTGMIAVKGELIDAMSTGGFIRKGATVKVVSVTDSYVVVQQIIGL